MIKPYETADPEALPGHTEEHHEGLPGTIGHVSPWQTLVKILAILFVLTVITVAVAQVDLGRLNVVGAIGIACVKASIVALWFMHLRYDKRFNFWIAIGSLAFVVWMVGYILFDTSLYQHNIEEYRNDKLQRNEQPIKSKPIPEGGHEH
jgi:cytochrome c oxidase subunit 4